MNESIIAFEQSIETAKNSLKLLRSELDEVEDRPDSPIKHRHTVLIADKINNKQAQLDSLERLLNSLMIDDEIVRTLSRLKTMQAELIGFYRNQQAHQTKRIASKELDIVNQTNILNDLRKQKIEIELKGNNDGN